jgi:hypothetical protein
MRAFLALLLLVAAALPAQADDKLVVGKAAPGAFSFVPLDIGVKEGFFAKQGLEIQSVGMSQLPYPERSEARAERSRRTLRFRLNGNRFRSSGPGRRVRNRTSRRVHRSKSFCRNTTSKFPLG